MFSKVVWPSVQLLLAGAILAVGTRTVTAVLHVMGHSEEQQFQKFHRILNRVKWSPLAASRRLLLALMEAFVPHGPLVMALDDTIERRQGARIAAKGIYRDPVRSSHSHFVKASGLRWLCLMLIAPIPWAHRDWALPFCTALTPSERYYHERGRRPSKLTDRARQMLFMVKRWLPQRDIVIVADSSFAAIDLLAAVSPQVCVITRLRLDAALYEPAAPRRANKVGRPRRKGVRLPTLQTVLANPRTMWQTVTVTRWYSQGERNVQVASGTALWYHTGKPVVPLRWVLVRDPQRRFKPQAFLCTNQKASPDQILNWFVKRWQVEVTFEEARAHLGMETQRQWSARAIARTTPVILALYSIVALLAKQRIKEQPIILRHAAWYKKEVATFSDTIALVRRWFWCKQALSTSEGPSEMIKIPLPLFDRLTETLSYAA
ncbi:transposase|nr:transposase [Noviherbaspirillum sp. L7-7A]MBV0879560.1 transposase [Noviherbaspirillum sp. L7-7A]